MKKELQSREDIELLINTFYDKVRKDTLIAFFFTDVVSVDWEHHLPTMYKFWENVVFYTGGYEGNPMEKHQQLNMKHPMNKAHFQRWLELFTSTVDELFEGEKAELIKQRALSIATVMQIRFVEQ